MTLIIIISKERRTFFEKPCILLTCIMNSEQFTPKMCHNSVLILLLGTTASLAPINAANIASLPSINQS